MSVIASTLLQLLGIRLPIVQAPMAGVSCPAMAAAVSNAGALGSIAVGAVDISVAAEMIRALRDATQEPFNVNVFCHSPAQQKSEIEDAWIERLRPQFETFGAQPPSQLVEIYRSFLVDDEMLALLLDQKPPVVSFHFGMPPAEKIGALRDAGILLVATATNVDEARAVEMAGLDAIVVQGWQAGGHRGCFDPDLPDAQLSTLELTHALRNVLKLPIIAAGGIMDGAGIATALKAGAAGAQLGTAFIACHESLADRGYREALAEAKSRSTVMTRVISGRPARCLGNKITEFGLRVEDAAVPDYPRAYALTKALNALATAHGEFGFGAQWAGQEAALARSLPARDLIDQLARELAEALP